MATTQLFIELLVIGIGVAIWLGLVVAAALGYPQLGTMAAWSGPLVSAFLGIAYVLGILVDRAAYSLFQPLMRRRREQVFGRDPKPSVDDRERFVLVRSEALREQILYNRSRLRICRAWGLNFLLISAGAGLWALQRPSWPAAALALACLVLGIFTASTANTLVVDHFHNIRASYEFLARPDSPSGE